MNDGTIVKTKKELQEANKRVFLAFSGVRERINKFKLKKKHKKAIKKMLPLEGEVQSLKEVQQSVADIHEYVNKLVKFHKFEKALYETRNLSNSLSSKHYFEHISVIGLFSEKMYKMTASLAGQIMSDMQESVALEFLDNQEEREEESTLPTSEPKPEKTQFEDAKSIGIPQWMMEAYGIKDEC